MKSPSLIIPQWQSSFPSSSFYFLFTCCHFTYFSQPLVYMRVNPLWPTLAVIANNNRQAGKKKRKNKYWYQLKFDFQRTTHKLCSSCLLGLFDYVYFTCQLQFYLLLICMCICISGVYYPADCVSFTMKNAK